MIMAKCDRCGIEEQTKGTTVAAGGIFEALPAFRETPVPDGWQRVSLPEPDGSSWKRELCPGCVNALMDFMRDDGAVAGLLELKEALREDGCNCPLPEVPRPPCPVHEKTVTGTDPDAPRVESAVIHTTAGSWQLPRCTCAGAGFGTEDCVVHHPDGLEKGTHLTCFQADQPVYAGDRCPGIYRRGMFAEHMSRWHGVKMEDRAKPCPFCATIESGIMKLGQHIAADHPGDWQAWIDGGQHAG